MELANLIRRIFRRKPLFGLHLSDDALIALDAHSSQAVFLTDETWQVTHRNPAAEALDPKSNRPQSVQRLLSGLVADPNETLFTVQSKLDTAGCALLSLSNRNNRIEISAKALPLGKTLWRVREARAHIATARQERDGLFLMHGRNGAVLSISAALQSALGCRPSNLRDIIAGGDGITSGPLNLRTPSGLQPYYCLVHERSAGRSEMQFFELPDWQEQNSLFEELPVAMVRLNPAGTIIAANDAAKNVLENKQPIGRRLHELLNGISLEVLTRHNATQSRKSVQFGRLVGKASDKFIQVSVEHTRTPAAPTRLAVLQDATELKSMEAQFVQSQKMQAIGQLAGGVAHDFNNLLTAISGHCDLLLLRQTENDPDYADLDQIRQNANRAASLVGQLLAFSRKQTLQKKPLDLEQTLSEHTHLLDRLVGEKIKLLLNHGANMKQIQADRRQLEQVIMNLVVNARDAMAGEGVINVTTSMRTFELPEIRDHVTIPVGEYCVITISDRGCGIPQDKLAHIFEPFFTTKASHEGTGLGLSTVYGIVKQTGGYVFVDSVVGVGTTFELIFPAFDGEMDDSEAQVSDVVEDISSKAEGVVLLVEDEAPVRAFASRALQLKGFSVLEAANAEDALNMLQDTKLSVDIFVTDVVMPGADGPTWVNEALKTRPDTKVVFVSGYAENRCDALKDDIPNSVFLPKPFSLNQLTSTVARLH